MERRSRAYLLRHPRAVPLHRGDAPDAHHAVGRAGGEEASVPAEVAEEHRVVALRGRGVGQREDAEFALRKRRARVGIGGVDGFGVPRADEAVVGHGEEEFADRIVAQLADEAAVRAAAEKAVAWLRGGVCEQRSDVPEHHPAVLAAAREDGVRFRQRQIGDFAAMPADRSPMWKPGSRATANCQNARPRL